MKTHSLSPLRHSTALQAFVAGLLASAFAVPTFSAPARQASAQSAIRGFAGDPVADRDLRPAERAFLTSAVENSRQQMRLAEVGVNHAANSEVRSHAQQLAVDYRQMTDGLEALISRKGVAGAPVGGTSESYRKLAESTTFDREFVRLAAQTTDRTLTLFEQTASDARDPDVRAFAAAQLPVLRAHRAVILALKKTMD